MSLAMALAFLADLDRVLTLHGVDLKTEEGRAVLDDALACLGRRK